MNWAKQLRHREMQQLKPSVQVSLRRVEVRERKANSILSPSCPGVTRWPTCTQNKTCKSCRKTVRTRANATVRTTASVVAHSAAALEKRQAGKHRKKSLYLDYVSVICDAFNLQENRGRSFFSAPPWFSLRNGTLPARDAEQAPSAHNEPCT